MKVFLVRLCSPSHRNIKWSLGPACLTSMSTCLEKCKMVGWRKQRARMFSTVTASPRPSPHSLPSLSNTCLPPPHQLLPGSTHTKPASNYVDRHNLKLLILRILSAGIVGMHCHTWFMRCWRSKPVAFCVLRQALHPLSYSPAHC